MNIVSTIINIRLLTVKIAGYQFSPSIFITLVTVIVVYILFSLGQWQLDRAEYKENLQQKIAERQNLPATTLQELPKSLDDRRYRPVNIEGHYDHDKQFLLDNRIVNGVVGYDVYTPFITVNGPALLINRGFVAQGPSRQQLPDISVSNQMVKLSGLMNKAPSKGIILADNLNDDSSWPVVLQYVDLKEISGMLNYQLMDMVLRVNKDENSPLIYHLPVLNLNAAKNHGYAFQWFAMMVTVCFLYLYLNTSKTNKHKTKNTSNEINGNKH